MCDGSVRFMSYNVDTNLYCNSATIGNGEVGTIQNQ
jgi:hypothetical protein